ncbi:hypothetical protein BD408DRAFT_412662 [Parasitella parasitica]|nr:hypothetical protein BD408DRAFT_412662 [Parasitella parasitica]
MNNFGRWLHLPRKRSNSTPTRQVLSEALQKLANEPPSQPQSQQYPHHNSSSDGYSSLSTNNTKNTSSFKANQSTPLLIASAYCGFSYSFDPDESPDDETPPEVANSRPSTPPPATAHLKTQQTHDLSNQNKQLPNDTHYSTHLQRDYEQDATLDYYHQQESQPITWHSKTSPRKIPSKKSGYSCIKRRPTPYVDQRSGYHSDGQEKNDIPYNHYEDMEYPSAMDDHQIRHTIAGCSGKMIDKDTYNEEVRKLKAEIKRLEKKHKEQERHMLDTQQQLEYLIISQSYESTFANNDVPRYSYSSSNNEHYQSSNIGNQHYHSQSLNERRPQRGNYWYPPYDMEYYYTNQTPSNSYSNHNTSFHPSSCKSRDSYDYFTLPKKSNDSINHGSGNATASSSGTSRRYDMNDNSNHYSYGYNPSSYVSNGAMDDENYYYHSLQQRRHQLLYYNRYLEQGFSLPSKKENNKRWSTCL